MWINFIKSKQTFLALLITTTLVGLAAVAKTYHAQVFPTVHPFVITYKVLHADSLLEEPKLQGYRVLAVRSDGAFMSANSVPDANGHIQTSRALQLKDRYMVVDPLTESVSTYEPYRPLVVPTQDCGGKADSPVLGYTVERVTQGGTGHQGGTVSIERSLAPALDCVPLRKHSILVTKTDQKVDVEEAISVTLGEPPAEYFDVPSRYQERGPADVSDEFAKRQQGRPIFSQQEVVDDLQKNYDLDQQKLIKEGKINPQ